MKIKYDKDRWDISLTQKEMGELDAILDSFVDIIEQDDSLAYKDCLRFYRKIAVQSAKALKAVAATSEESK